MSAKEDRGRSGLFRRIAAGLLLFAVGAALALALLPEWSAAGLRGEGFFAARYRQLATRAGFRLLPGEPRVSLTASDAPERDPRSGTGSTLRAEVRHAVRHPGETQEQFLEISFTPDGRPREVSWQNYAASVFTRQDPALYERLSRETLSPLLAPGESLGSLREERGPGFTSSRALEIAGSSPAGASPGHL